jgi:hypothetical protein
MSKLLKGAVVIGGLVCLLCPSGMAISGQYRMTVDLKGFKNCCDAEDTNTYTAPAGSRFMFVTDESGMRIVKFKSRPHGDTTKDPSTNTAAWIQVDGIYIIDANTLKSYTYRLVFGIDHGPLIVPFKLRTRDNKITGVSSLDYYVGIKSSYLFISPTIFASAGLSVIDVSDINSGAEENRAGVSYAVGMTLQTADQFQISFVMGWDHLGGDAGANWEYEGNRWFSFALGFSLWSSEAK